MSEHSFKTIESRKLSSCQIIISYVMEEEAVLILLIYASNLGAISSVGNSVWRKS